MAKLIDKFWNWGHLEGSHNDCTGLDCSMTPEEFAEEYGIRNSFIVSYGGNIQPPFDGLAERLSGLREIKYMLHPRAVVSVKLEGKPVEMEVVRSASSFIIVYIMLFAVSFFAFNVVEECDLVTGFTAVATCINNVGPGLGEVGPAGNFSAFTSFTKLMLSFVMLAGRLEIFPMIMLLAPSTWRSR